MNIDELGLNVPVIDTPHCHDVWPACQRQWLVNMADVLYGSVITSREPNIKICTDNKLQTLTYVA